MGRLSYTTIELYAAAAGLPDPAKWAAIAMAESSGDPARVNNIGCVGLWQINQPVWVGQHPKWTTSWLKDPMHNAMAAKVVYDAQGLGAWEGYTNGNWKKFYKKGSGAVPADFDWGDIFGPPTGDDFQRGWDAGQGVGDQLLGPFGDIADFAAKAGNWISNPHNWVRVGYVVGGTLVALIGVQMLVREIPAVKKAQGMATSFVGGKVKAARSASSQRRASDARVQEAYDKTAARAKARADAKKEK